MPSFGDWLLFLAFIVFALESFSMIEPLSLYNNLIVLLVGALGVLLIIRRRPKT